MKFLLQTFFILLSTVSCGQFYADIEIPKTSLTSWKVNSISECQGTYKFGVSEGECEMRIIIWDTIVIAQTSYYAVDTTTGGFKAAFENFTNVRIKNNKFFSDQSNGEFVIYKNEHGTVTGLFIYKPWTYKFNDGGEFGSRFPDEGVYLVGDYPFTSTKIVTEKELEKYSSQELKIIRNEIYARYGFIFQDRGQMDKYFSQKKWYKKSNTHVDQWLTSIELTNIETIKKVEKNKNGL